MPFELKGISDFYLVNDAKLSLMFMNPLIALIQNKQPP